MRMKDAPKPGHLVNIIGLHRRFGHWGLFGRGESRFAPARPDDKITTGIIPESGFLSFISYGI